MLATSKSVCWFNWKCGEQDRLAVRLIGDHFAELQQHKLPNLSKQIGIDVKYS